MENHPKESDLNMDKLTRDDLKKIEKSMKRPEFMGLLNEYMVQISDPKNKNEYDEYLRQMQREKELPKHMKIVQIKPRFCFRTFIVSQKNKKHEMKFFVNMCESQYLEKPSCEPAPTSDGKVGYNWKVPNSMGKIRYDQDKKGNPCQVVDIAFHPDTYMFAIKKQFQQMMVNIALQAAERQLGERKETLSRDYVILKNVICKGQDGKPALMPIRYIEGKMYNKGQGPSNEMERDMEGRQTKLQKQLNKQKEDFAKQKKQDKQAKGEQQDKEQQIQQGPKLVVDLQQGVQRPKYSTIYTYPVDYSQFIDSPYTKKRTVPTAFNIQFSIPRVESMDEIAGQQLQINDKKILLKIGQKYFIDLQLQELKIKYVLLTSSARAKYDKKKKCLRIIIPVDQSVKYEPQKVEEDGKNNESVGNIVENETWKNKVLDFTDPNVSVKMLEPTEKAKEEKPKLIEEIEEEDIIEESKPVVSPAAGEEDQIQQQPPRQPEKKFTLSNYYSQPNKEKKQGQTRRIGYLFQQTSDKIVLVLQMKNYKKEEVKCLVWQNHEFLIVWDQIINKETFEKYEHLRLTADFKNKVQKIETVFRVGFLAVMIMKTAEQKGKYWQKEAVQQVAVVGESEEEKFIEFKKYFNQKQQLQQEQRKIIEEEKKTAQKTEIAKKIQSTEIKANNLSDSTKSPPPSEQVEEPQAPLPSEVIDSSPSQLPSVSRQGLFRTLQPQFIAFSAPFVAQLD